MNGLLSIAIPTYNRASILLENIEYMLPDLKRHQIAVYVSDDSTDRETENLLRAIDYDNIFYFKNEPSLGHDKNCLSTLSLVQTKYVWYLGDSVYIEKNGLDRILQILQSNDYEMVFVNSNNSLNASSGKVDNVSSFLNKNLWYLTLSGATIYSLMSLKGLLDKQVRIYRNFMQLGLILEIYRQNLSMTRLYWVNEELVLINQKKISYWSKAVFQTFCVDWAELVDSFDDVFTKKERDDIILSHSRNTKIFGLFKMLVLRSQDILSYSVYRRYKFALSRASHLPLFIVFIISWLPRRFLQVCYRCASRLRTKKKFAR